MATATDVLNLARSQLGVSENPPGSNRGTPYHKWYGPESEGWQWCAIFVCWVFQHVDPSLIHGLHSAYSGDYLTTGRRNCEETPRPVPGCIAVMDYGDGGITDHIGIVESVSGNYMTLIEGNHNNRVERVTRALSGSTKFWYIMPPYSAAPKEEEDDMALVTSGEPVNSFGGIFYVGTMGGKAWDVWAKAQNPTDKQITARFVCITNDTRQVKEVAIGANKIVQVQGAELKAKGNSLMVIESSVACVMTFDHRPT